MTSVKSTAAEESRKASKTGAGLFLNRREEPFLTLGEGRRHKEIYSTADY
jgi:hypothetical protein